MKLKIFIATGIVLVTGLIVFAGCRHHRFCKGFPPERVADFVNSKIDTIVDVLTLTEDQQKQFKNLRDRIKSDLVKYNAKNSDKKELELDIVFEKLILLDTTRKIPVIFMTAYPKSEIKNKVTKMGAMGFVSKPFVSADFEQTIDMVITN